MTNEKPISIEIIFNGEKSSEYELEIDPRVTANQVWIVSNYLGFLAEHSHEENRMAMMLAKQRQMEMEKQSKLYIPEPKLTKPN